MVIMGLEKQENLPMTVLGVINDVLKVLTKLEEIERFQLVRRKIKGVTRLGARLPLRKWRREEISTRPEQQ